MENSSSKDLFVDQIKSKYSSYLKENNMGQVKRKHDESHSEARNKKLKSQKDYAYEPLSLNSNHSQEQPKSSVTLVETGNKENKSSSWTNSVKEGNLKQEENSSILAKGEKNLRNNNEKNSTLSSSDEEFSESIHPVSNTKKRKSNKKLAIFASESDEELPFKNEKLENNLALEPRAKAQNKSLNAVTEESDKEENEQERHRSESDNEISSESEKSYVSIPEPSPKTQNRSSSEGSEESEDETNKMKSSKKEILGSEDEEMSFESEKLGNNLVLEHSDEAHDRSLSASSGESEGETNMRKSNQKTPKRKRERITSESDENVSSKSEKSDDSSALEQSAKTQNSLGMSLGEKEKEIHVKKSNQKIPKRKTHNIDSSDSEEQDSDSECESTSSLADTPESKKSANRQNGSNDHSDSEEAASHEKNKTPQGYRAPVSEKNKVNTTDSDASLSSEDEEPLSKVKLKKSVKCGDDKLKRNNEGVPEEELKPVSKKDLEKAKRLKNRIDSSDSSESSSSEDEEPLSKIKLKESTKSVESKQKKSNGVDNKDKAESVSKKSMGKATKESKTQKDSSKVNNKIEHLKKYIRTAGIHVQSYSKLFENCKSGKAKVEKLLELLRKEGLKGQPTLQKCKKLRKKIEKRKEVAELDIKNIIVSEGRPRRGRQTEQVQMQKENQADHKFSRILDIIGSEESD